MNLEYAISSAGSLITEVCINGIGGGSGGFSGQTFFADDGGWNFVASYCNGDESPSTPPSNYGPPNEGVNGLPQITCGDDNCPLPASECRDDSIVITETARMKSSAMSTLQVSSSAPEAVIPCYHHAVPQLWP